MNTAIADFNTTQLLEHLKIANDVFLFGYPTSLGLTTDDYFDNSRPLLRKGIISGINYKKETFIIDCASYYGNSGGPVAHMNEDGAILLAGLVSKYIPLEIKWYNNRERIHNIEYVNSGYTVCVPMNPIYHLLKKIIPQIHLE